MRGLLFSQMEPPAGERAAFESWYDEEHIPARLAIPGFDAAARFWAVEGEPSHLACYFLGDIDALESSAYQQVKQQPTPRTAAMLGRVTGFTRYTCDEIADTGAAGVHCGLLFVVAFDVPLEHRADFDAWYSWEHVPMLMEADGWLRVRRYTVREGGEGPPITHLALHELRDESAFEAPQREAARTTPWRARLAEHPWFGRSLRWTYRPTTVREAPTIQRGAR